MSSIITNAGLALIAKLQAEHKVLNIDKFIYAYIPDLDAETEVDPAETMPEPDQIVHESTVTKEGYADPNTVVFSNLLGTNIGDFEFNWIGLYSTENDTLCVIYHQYPQNKWKTKATIIGNMLAKNIGIQYLNITDLTNITIKAETWQMDLTNRLDGMDNREQASNYDLYGEKYFTIEQEDAFLVYENEGTYYAKPGIGYVMGIRVESDIDSTVGLIDALPSNVYIDTWLDGDYTGVEAKYSFIVSAEEQSDYIDASGQQHYVQVIAAIAADGTITDLRAGTKGKINKLDNKKVNYSDNPDLDDSDTGASTKATKVLADRIKTSTKATQDLAKIVEENKAKSKKNKTDIDNHAKEKTNPHKVTASQVGCYSKDQSDSRYVLQSSAWKRKSLSNNTQYTMTGFAIIQGGSTNGEGGARMQTEINGSEGYGNGTPSTFGSNPGAVCFGLNSGNTFKLIRVDSKTTKSSILFRAYMFNGTSLEGNTSLEVAVMNENNVYSHNEIIGSADTVVPTYKTQVMCDLADKSGLCKWFNEKQKVWEHKTDPYPDHRQYCKWVEGKGYELDQDKEPELDAELVNMVKTQTNANMEKAKWMRETEELQFEHDEIHMQYTNIESALAFVDSLKGKSMEEKISMLNPEKLRTSMKLTNK